MTRLKTRALILLTLAAAMAGQAEAKKLATFAGSIDLPFDFQVKDQTESAKNAVSGFSVSQVVRIQIESGPLKGHDARLGAFYFASSKIDSALMQAWVQKSAEDNAAKPGASGFAPIQLAGFPFIVLTTNASHGDAGAASAGKAAITDAPTGSTNEQNGDPDMARITTMSGTINNAMITVSLLHSVSAEFDASATKAVKELDLDFGSILKLRSRFDLASQAAIVDKKMIAPTGDYATVDDLVPRVYEMWVKKDGQGKPIAAKNIYTFFKVGFWANQRMSFGSFCDLGLARDEKELAKLKKITSGSTTDRLVVTDGPVSIKFGGLDATRITTKHTTQSGATTTESDGLRWVATDHDIAYVIDTLTAGGSSLERSLVSQIDSRPLTCKPKAMLVLGSTPVGNDGGSH